MTAQQERSPGQLGPYRLRERLGEGGMGVVYLAADPAGRPVAVKALRRGVPGEVTARRRLTREFETMRRVHSPYVAQVIDADVESDPPYIVTRYVPGRTLEDVVAQDGPLTGLGLLKLARGLACALAAVHAAGVVHRDLKPANVMIVGGEPVVIDFGIAQAPDSTRLTMTGMFMGTPGYLAPEVIEGNPSGPAADVHSWAATVAFAATGRPPFGSGSFEAIFYRIVNGQPDLAALPTPLLPLVLHALARDPSRRPAAAELADRVATVDPAGLVPQLAATIPPGTCPPVGATRGEMPPWPEGAGAALALPGAAPAPWPGTRQLAAPAPADYADLLPPFSYGQPPPPPPPVRAGDGGQQGAQRSPPQARAADRPRSARRPLVLAVVATAIAGSVLLPVGGTIAALLGLVGLRSADLTSTWLGRRRSRQGARGGDSVAALAFLPVAIFRSLIRLLFMLPLALLVAAAVAAATLVAEPGHPVSRALAYGAGALVGCCALGPGSGACRRPLSRFFGRVTTTAPSTIVVFVGMTALAVGVVTAAFSLPAFFWPAAHLQPHHLPLLNGVVPHDRLSLVRLARRLGLWPFH